jgi:formiminotetrahydrofolate cyclodeaminase
MSVSLPNDTEENCAAPAAERESVDEFELEMQRRESMRSAVEKATEVPVETIEEMMSEAEKLVEG